MNIRESSIVVDKAVIYYRTAGDPAKQTVVFLHGWPGTYLAKSKIIPELEKYFYVVSPEHPGLLHSDPLPHYENIFDQYADVVRKILQAEDRLKNPVVIIGQSFGGPVAAAFADRYPNDTAALVLSDADMGAGRADTYTKLLFNLGSILIRPLPYLPSFLQKIILKVVFGTTVMSDALWRQIKSTIPNRVAMTVNYCSLIAESRRVNKKLIDKNYGNFPVIFSWGDKDGKEFNMYGYCPIDEAERLHEELKQKGKDSYFFTFPGGHSVIYQKPELICSTLIKHLPH